MFIETYHDERSAPGPSSVEPAISYPELLGEELRLWQSYLPERVDLKDAPLQLKAGMPHLVTEQLQNAQNAPGLFDRIEIWSRSGDPMAVGIIGERVFSIARWGDAELTIGQVKRGLLVEQWTVRVIFALIVLIFLVGIWALVSQWGQFPDLIQTAFSQGDFW